MPQQFEIIKPFDQTKFLKLLGYGLTITLDSWAYPYSNDPNNRYRVDLREPNVRQWSDAAGSLASLAIKSPIPHEEMIEFARQAVQQGNEDLVLTEIPDNRLSLVPKEPSPHYPGSKLPRSVIRFTLIRQPLE